MYVDQQRNTGVLLGEKDLKGAVMKHRRLKRSNSTDLTGENPEFNLLMSQAKVEMGKGRPEIATRYLAS